MGDVKLLPCEFKHGLGDVAFPCEFAGEVNRYDAHRKFLREMLAVQGRDASTEDAFVAGAQWATKRNNPALTPKQAAADTPEQMRERCFHDFLLLLEGCAAGVGKESARVLRSFARTLRAQGTAGLGTGICDCGADDCPYKNANVPCDCGLPDCSDPRAALAKAGQP